MTTSVNFAFDASIAASIGEDQKIIDKAKGTKASATQDTNEAKVRQYANLMAGVFQAPRYRGNLAKQAREAVADAMEGVKLDISKGVGARLYTGAVAITNPANYKRIIGEELPGDNATAAYFEARLIEAELTTEAKIQAAISPANSNDPVDQAVRKFVGGFTYSKDDDGNKYVSGWRTGGEAEKLAELRLALNAAERIADAVKEAGQDQEGKEIDMAAIIAQINAEDEQAQAA